MNETHYHLAKSHQSPSICIVGINFRDALTDADGCFRSPKIALTEGDVVLPRHQEEIVSLDTLRAALFDGLFLFRQELEFQRLDDRFGNFVLQGENVVEIAVVTFRPDVIVVAPSINCAVIRTRPRALRTLPSSTWLTFSCRATCRTSTFLPLKANALFLAITEHADTLLRSVMMSSVMPSINYSCSGSPLMLSNGSTQMESLRGVSTFCAEISSRPAARTWNTCTGRSMFLTVCSPMSSKTQGIFPSMLSRTILDRATPPTGASVCSRAATLTPSP